MLFRSAAIDAREVNSFDLGEGITLRVGRYGNYLELGEGESRRTTNIPDDMAPDELNLKVAKQLFDRPSGERTLGVDATTGFTIVAKDGRYGPYITEILPEDAPKKVKARTASLFKTMSLDTVTFEDAEKLLTLPRLVGIDPDLKVEITAQNGPFGPYLKRGTDSRQLTTEDELFTVNLADALALFAQPKFRGRGVAKPPLKDLGIDPTTTRAVVVKDGRFGVYVTDGETNATLRRSDPVESLTLDRALELLTEKRAKDLETGPAPRKSAAKKAPARKKAPAKKAPAKSGSAVG